MFLKIQQGTDERKKKPKRKSRKKSHSHVFYAEREDMEASKASFDKASKNTVSTLTRLHLYHVNAVGTLLSFLLM